MENFSLYINGVLRTVCVPPQWTLLRVLRETLGLTGAKMSLEEQLGGSVWVDSIQNERTTFWVRVPAANLAETAKKAKEDEVHL